MRRLIGKWGRRRKGRRRGDFMCVWNCVCGGGGRQMVLMMY